MSPSYDPRAQERLIIGAVVLIGVVTLVFGFYGIRKQIFGPFLRSGEPTYKTPEQQHKDALEALKLKDTDRDSLSDYDEIYLYRTNPYLEDTDSDGLADGVEVNTNSDPNCPSGTSCLQPRVASGSGAGSAPSAGLVETPTNSSVTSDQTDSALGTDEEQAYLAFIDIFGDPRELTKAEAQARVAGLSSSDLRDLFVKMGVPQDAVDRADDQTLRQLALEALDQITFGTDLTSDTGQ